MHQFCLAGLGELLGVEVLYALQRRDLSPPPMDPTQVRILLTRLTGAGSLRDADPTDRLRERRHCLQLRDRADCSGTCVCTWTGPGRSTPAPTRSPGTCGRWRCWACTPTLLGRGAATHGVVDFRPIELPWLREIVKDWARATRPHLQRLRETLRACQAASQTLTAAGRVDPATLGAGDFTRIIDAITGQRRADGTVYSAAHRNLLLYQFCQVIEHGRGSGLMAAVPDQFRPAHRHRVRAEPNEDELGKALPDTVIRQLDAPARPARPSRPGPASITATDLQQMHRTIYQILRDTGRRPGEVVSLRVGCVEIIDGQHNLIYDNHKAGRLRRRLPITSQTAELVLTWQARRSQLLTPPATAQWLFPSPLLRAQQSHGHVTPACVCRAFKVWVQQIGTIHGELLGPDGRPAPFDTSLVTPYALRHSYAQRHADAGVPVDVLKELMDHAAVATTMGYYRVSLKRKQQAIRSVGSLATDANGNPAPFTSPTAYQRASVPSRSATAPNRPTSPPAAVPARSVSNAPAAASTGPTPPTCPPWNSTSPTCAPTGKPPARSAPPTTCWPTSPPRSTRSPGSPSRCTTGSPISDPTNAPRSSRPAACCAGPGPAGGSH